MLRVIPVVVIAVFVTGEGLFGQPYTITGSVHNMETGQPVEGANVFISGTLSGTTTNPNGEYVLRELDHPIFELVVSHISYETVFQRITLEQPSNQIDFGLQPSIVQLENVLIQDTEDKAWRRNFRRFEAGFLGSSINARKTEILNPWVIEFKNLPDGLEATATQMLEVDNHALGFKVHFLLGHFKITGPNVTYSGKYHFEELVVDDQKSVEKWSKARLRTYQGSLRHFLCAVFQDDLNNQGFIVHRSRFDARNNLFEVSSRMLALDLIQVEGAQGFLDFPEFIRVMYTQEVGTGLSGRSTTSTRLPEGREGSFNQDKRGLTAEGENYQVSYLFLTKSPIRIYADGSTPDREYIKEYGLWAGSGVADLLPTDYSIHKD